MKPFCPCNPTTPYESCCAKYHSNQSLPQTPEQLMRSRYSAYTQANIDYIALTMQSPASDNFDKPSAAQWAKQVKWQKLEVIKSSQEGDIGFVEFIAYFKENGRQLKLHELSEFHRIDGKWFYVSGKLY